MKTVLPNIIHSDQKGFHKGRYIGENTRLIYDVLLTSQLDNVPGLLVLLDFEKAFDTLSWNFVDKVLRRFNFGIYFRKWVEVFYAKITSCVINNGNFSNFFSLERGVSSKRSAITLSFYYLCGNSRT